MRLQQLIDEQIRTDPAYAAAALEFGAAQDLADRIVDLRLQAGLTQAQLAEMARLTQPTISRLEAGVDNPTLETLERVGRALGVRLEFSGIEVAASVDLFESRTDTALGGRAAIYADSTAGGVVTFQTRHMSVASLAGTSAANAEYALAA